ncbi:MAG: septum formation initiator family protein [Candidatus Omnitrophota bacterium]|nr:MAG: septum formation initiator family protein [Candidatus Omnitrophota bacterium]
MRVRLSNTRYSKFTKITFLVSLIAAVFFVVYFPNYTRLKKLRQANVELLSRVKVVEKEIAELEQKLDKVGKDPAIYETIARQDLGVARKNEIVVDIAE